MPSRWSGSTSRPDLCRPLEDPTGKNKGCKAPSTSSYSGGANSLLIAWVQRNTASLLHVLLCRLLLSPCPPYHPCPLPSAHLAAHLHLPHAAKMFAAGFSYILALLASLSAQNYNLKNLVTWREWDTNTKTKNKQNKPPKWKHSRPRNAGIIATVEGHAPIHCSWICCHGFLQKLPKSEPTHVYIMSTLCLHQQTNTINTASTSMRRCSCSGSMIWSFPVMSLQAGGWLICSPREMRGTSDIVGKTCLRPGTTALELSLPPPIRIQINKPNQQARRCQGKANFCRAFRAYLATLWLRERPWPHLAFPLDLQTNNWWVDKCADAYLMSCGIVKWTFQRMRKEESLHLFQQL